MGSPGWRIKQVRHKANRDKFSLSFLQFVYVNGAVSPECYAQSASDSDTIVSIDLDPSKIITGV